MNTKTMRLPPRRVLTPNKRKERERPSPPPPAPPLDTLKPSTPTPQPITKLPKPSAHVLAASSVKPAEPLTSHLLAGYLAHEFLTKGTLFGQPFDPARAESPPVSGAEPRNKKLKPTQKESGAVSHHERYVEVSSLLKIDGTHLPGILNPTQLSRLLQM